ncbi:DUF3721 domain-containing protein [Synechococcus sp. UW179A]|uniref:DUF3721 domain-containing protein n=1 Tax=Synechococcus sp. UW179A TaxID=2575510 RepID=UPI001FCC5015|nr:DUF3721 domain-containing protein [Synechococcus sp. UW179A]
MSSLMLLSNRSVVRGSLAALAALTLVGAQSARAHHVPGDDHTGTLLSGDSTSTAQGMKSIFSTKAEAEAAAPGFNCSGAHKMGNQWMPCSSHGHGAH